MAKLTPRLKYMGVVLATDSSPGMILQVIEEGFKPQPPQKNRAWKGSDSQLAAPSFQGVNGKLAGWLRLEVYALKNRILGGDEFCLQNMLQHAGSLVIWCV